MSKPSWAHHFDAGLRWRLAAVVMIIIGVAARGFGASVSVSLVFAGLAVVCLVVSAGLAVAFSKKARQDNYGIRIRTGDAGRDEQLNAELTSRTQAKAAQQRPGKEWGLLVLTIVLFWPALIAVAVLATSANPSPVMWAVAVVLVLLFALSAVDWVRAVRR